MNALAVIAEPALPVVFEAELELASDFAKASKSAATLKAYRTDFSIFEAWCRGRGLNALLARCKAVVAFFAAQAGAGKPASTLQRRLAAIGYMHKIACRARLALRPLRPPFRAIRRSIGAAPVRKKGGHKRHVLGMAATVGGESLRQLRDRTSRGCHRLGGCAAPRV
jgi:hypothetical protein